MATLSLNTSQGLAFLALLSRQSVKTEGDEAAVDGHALPAHNIEAWHLNCCQARRSSGRWIATLSLQKGQWAALSTMVSPQIILCTVVWRWPCLARLNGANCCRGPMCSGPGVAEGPKDLLVTLSLRQVACAWPCRHATRSCLAAPQGGMRGKGRDHSLPAAGYMVCWPDIFS